MRAANNLERVKNRDFGNLCGYISDSDMTYVAVY